MFDFDKWQEIFDTMKHNKLRSFLTGFAVAWGIFMLMILLGSGNGLSNGVNSNFNGSALNSMWIWNRRTSEPYKGFPKDRSFSFHDKDYFDLSNISGVDKISARYYLNSSLYKANFEYGNYSSEGVHPDIQEVEKFVIEQGRFINNIDIEYKRKVICIGHDIAEALFENVDPIDQMIEIGGVPFRVIGVYAEESAQDESNQGYMPITTVQKLYNAGDVIHGIALSTVDVNVNQSLKIEQEIRSVLKRNNTISPDDDRAIGIWNSFENYNETQKIFTAIDIFIWLIGIGTLIAGIVGVSNIMLIVVKERTREIGIRKALGASPKSVINLILLEAIMITSLAGYVGMVLGIGILEIVNFGMNQQVSEASTDEGSFQIFVNPSVDLNVAISAMVLLVIAGTIAGYIPARRAASVKPIEALRAD